jgi:predicted deacetylase
MRPLCAVTLHDVAPTTWAECASMLAQLDAVGIGPVTLLVVPNLHGRAPLLESACTIEAIEARRRHGDDIVLHGYYHRDDAPAPHTARDFVQRRLRTDSEGEFAALDYATTLQRVKDGMDLWDFLGWPCIGLVPPAWLAGKALWMVVDRFPALRYISLRQGIYTTADQRLHPTTNLTRSSTSAAGRVLTGARVRYQYWRSASSPLLRVALHPPDMRSRTVTQRWMSLLADVARKREFVTKAQWLARREQQLVAKRAAA